MACSLEISFSEFQENEMFFQIHDCTGFSSFVATFPKDKTKVYSRPDMYGIEVEGQEKPYIIIQPTGYFEYIGEEVEFNINKLPSEIIQGFIEYAETHNGQFVTEPLQVSSEDPQQVAGKRRKTRKNKNKKKYVKS